MKKYFLALVLLLPSPIAVFCLKLLGFKIGRKVKIGFSLIIVNSITMSDNSSIGHGCICKCDSISMKENSYIGRLNILFGPFTILLSKYAAIGNSNKITRGPRSSATSHRSFLKLGELSKITANHRIDVTRSILFGRFAILAGTNSQIWTHGYVHAEKGPGRYRIDGPVVIGNNVYIGSRSLITSGVKISSSIQIGAGAVVSKSISEKGVYVSQGLRVLPLPPEPDQRLDLKFDEDNNEDRIFIKNI